VESFLLAQLIHPLDFSLDFCGEFDDIHVFVSKNNTPLFLQVIIQFKNGTIGSIESGTGAPRFIHSVEVLGSESVIARLNHLWQLELIDKSKRTAFIDNAKLWSSIYTPSPLNNGFERTGYIEEIQRFVNSIRKEKYSMRDFLSMKGTFRALDIIAEKIRAYREE
jgi:predicted dehydrogenase